VQRHRHQTNVPKPEAGQGFNLDPHVAIARERIARSQVLCHGVRFHLDKDILAEIQRARETGRSVTISGQLLADLRVWALLGRENYPTSSLVFSTYYQQGDAEEALMRSTISPDGNILNQIRADCLERPDFCDNIAAAHYWLIAQLLGQLPLGAIRRFHWLPWGLSVVIVAVGVLPFIGLLVQVSPWLLIVPIVLIGLLQIVLRPLLVWLFPTLGCWQQRQLLSGLLSRQGWRRAIARRILARL
jgi:hypothetical protein